MSAAIQQAQRANHSPLTSMSHRYDNSMPAREYEIQVFVRENGKAPFEQFVQEIRDKHARAQIYSRIDRLRPGLREGTKRTQRADITRAHAYAKELKANANEEL